jgi:hypothetical protein
MTDFIALTAASGPRINDQEAVRQLLNQYYFVPAFRVGIGQHPEMNAPRLFLEGGL